MAVVVAGGRARTAQAAGMQWREQGARSPEMAPPPRPARAAVVYYLSRNGHLEHPHFMEVALSCPADGLYLRGTYGVYFAIAFCRSIESFLVERSVMELVRSVCGADVVDRLDALRWRPGQGVLRAQAARLVRVCVRQGRARYAGAAARAAAGVHGQTALPRQGRGGQGVLQREHHRDGEALAGR
jgi:hypothetical protein